MEGLTPSNSAAPFSPHTCQFACRRAEIILDFSCRRNSVSVRNPALSGITRVVDATVAAQVEEGDGFAAAMVNYRFIANTVWSTREATAAVSAAD